MSQLYPPTSNLQIERQLWLAYGPFQPGTLARALRWENWDHGLKTCWNPACLRGFKAENFTDENGKRHQPGRGRFYCSRTCARAGRAAEAVLFEEATFTDEHGAEL